jgi:hypothetical protein
MQDGGVAQTAFQHTGIDGLDLARCQGLMDEVIQAEMALERQHQAFKTAEAAREFADLKYSALRDVLEFKLGRPSYLPDVFKTWPEVLDHPDYGIVHGKWRYINKKMGAAIIEVLFDLGEKMDLGFDARQWEDDEPTGSMTVSEISNELREGGSLTATPRAVNAALINSKSFVRSEEGKWRLAPGVEPYGTEKSLNLDLDDQDIRGND